MTRQTFRWALISIIVIGMSSAYAWTRIQQNFDRIENNSSNACTLAHQIRLTLETSIRDIAADPTMPPSLVTKLHHLDTDLLGVKSVDQGTICK